MKTKYIFHFVCIVVFALFYFSISSCKKDVVTSYVDYGNYVFVGDGSSAQLIPAGTGNGTSKFRAIYDANQKEFNYTLTWKNLDSTVTLARIYGPNPAGQTNAAILDIFNATPVRAHTDSLSSAAWGLNALSDQQVADLKAGKWYYIISTTSSPNGAVRGSIKLSSTFFKNQ